MSGPPICINIITLMLHFLSSFICKCYYLPHQVYSKRDIDFDNSMVSAGHDFKHYVFIDIWISNILGFHIKLLRKKRNIFLWSPNNIQVIFMMYWTCYEIIAFTYKCAVSLCFDCVSVSVFKFISNWYNKIWKKWSIRSI
jgi:hypothetical protein